MSTARDIVITSRQGRWAAVDFSVPVLGERGWLMLGALVCVGGLLLHFSVWDRSLFFWINGNQWLPDQLLVALGISGLGVSVLVLSGAWPGRPPGLFSGLLMAFAVGSVAVHLVKYGLNWPRPLAVLPAGAVHVAGQLLQGRSMPSGHAAVVFAWLSLVGLCGPRHGLRFWCAALLAVAVGYSRVAAGAHWPADVLVGAGLGLCIGAVSAHLAGRLGLARRLQLPRAQIAIRLGWMAVAAYLLSGPPEFSQIAPLAWLMAVAALWSARPGFTP